MTGFLPEGYTTPQDSGKYLKFKDGDTRFRVLSNPIIGWEDWDDNRKVYRFKMNDKPDKSKSAKKEARIKHFWAMKVWNYNEKQIQVLVITQSSIQRVIETLSLDEDWGSPQDYDIVVNRKGEGLDTEYQVTPKPKKDMTDDILEAQKSIRVNLEALYAGADPFNSSPMNEDVDPDFMNKAIT